MRAPLISRVSALAEPRHGVVSRQLLLRHDVDHELPSREVQAGRWQVLLPGVYLTSSDEPTLLQRCHAAVLHAGRRAVLTGNAACVLRGVPGAVLDDPTVAVLVPRHLDRISNTWCHLTRTLSLPPAERVQGLPVAPAERAVADAVRRAADLGGARALLCSARQSVDWDLLTSEARRSVPAPYLKQVVRDLEDGVRSPAEGDVHDVVLRAARRGAFPPYLLNPEVYLDGQLLGSPDLWVVGLGLGSEVDSRQWHEEEQLLDRTLLRHEGFRVGGLHLAHVTPGRFGRSPDTYLEHLRVLAAERASMRRPEPEHLVVLARGPLLPHRTPWPMVAPERRGLGVFRRRAA